MKAKKTIMHGLLLVLLVFAVLFSDCVERPSTELPESQPAAPAISPVLGETSPLTPTTEPTSITATTQRGGPILSGALKRGCQPRGSGDFSNVGLAEGEVAVDFTLNDIHGNKVSLSGLLQEKPVVIVLGSFT